jgi:uncharacterized protein involved in exopolysaccharide biosynthesis
MVDIERAILHVRLRWHWALLVILLSLAIGLVAAFVPRPVYRATVVLLPAAGDDASGSLASLAGQVSGLASLVGLSGSLGQQKEATLATLKSRSLFVEYAEREGLLAEMFEKQWDQEKRRWRPDLEADDVPTMDDAWERFDRRIRRVSQDQKTGIITLDIFWKDRAKAASWANGFAAIANERLRRQAVSDADAALAALGGELQDTQVVELRQTIYRLMEAQIKRKILAGSRRGYAFTVLDPATPPDSDRFDSPKRMLSVAMALVLGLMAAAIVMFLPSRRLSDSRTGAMRE